VRSAELGRIRRSRTALPWLSIAAGVLWLGSGRGPAALPAGQVDPPAAALQGFLAQHCLSCHSAPDPEGGLDLEGALDLAPAAFAAEIVEHAAHWQVLAGRVAASQMPPADAARKPSSEARAAFLRQMEQTLARRYDPAVAADPGAPTLRRLSRREVGRTLRDLFGLDFPVESWLPEDQSAAGFDNLGSGQALAPDAVPGLLEFAGAVAERVWPVDDPDRAPVRHYGGEAFEPRGGFLSSNGRVRLRHRFEAPGAYRLTVESWSQAAGPDPARAAWEFGGQRIATFDVLSNDPDLPQRDRFEHAVESAGEVELAVAFLNDYWQPDPALPDPGDRNLGVLALSVEGPLGPPPRTALQRELDAAFPPELGERRAAALVEYLLLRLWRRPARPLEVERLLELSAGDPSLDRRVALALEALLAAPDFHFRPELDPGPGNGPRDLDGYELATRLSYFLWSSAPDGELLRAAGAGELQSEQGLRDQWRRLLRDPRAGALAQEFAPQWLALEVLARREVPAETRALFAAMVHESEALFDAVLREGRPAADLLRADFGFVDGQLAAHYDLPPPRSPFFERVSLAGTGRRGLLGQGAVLTATSDPGRTSPVLRGRWVLEVLLGEGTPPAPPAVPALEASGSVQHPADLRAALAQHRADPACAVCHDRIDPLGFSLEGFDAQGRRRGEPLDLRGELPDGTVIESLEQLAEHLAADPRFLRTLLERLTVYGLGRPLGAADRGQIARSLARLDPRTATLEQLLGEVILSPAFRRRGSLAPR
jgi:hypothetical protein